MIYITFFATITLLIYGIIVMFQDRRQHMKRRLSIFFSNQKNVIESDQEQEKIQSFMDRVFSPLWKYCKRNFQKKIRGEKVEKLELKLMQAGNPFGMTHVEFRLLQLTLYFLLPLLAVGYGFLLKVTTGSMILLGIVGILGAIILPGFYLKQKIKARNKEALKELPDILDLLTVSLEAGLGFDSAMSKVVSKKKGVLANEFHRCLEEIRLGKTRKEAMAGIRERMSIEEVKSLISSIIQAEKLGIGMVQVLRVQSNEVRELRKQRAEEEAMKAPIKMLFPLVLFIFPSLFIVLLGPAIIQFLQTFNE